MRLNIYLYVVSYLYVLQQEMLGRMMFIRLLFHVAN